MKMTVSIRFPKNVAGTFNSLIELSMWFSGSSGTCGF